MGPQGALSAEGCLRALGGVSRYQLLQAIVVSLGNWGAAAQLFDNVFIGRKVTWHACSRPDKNSIPPSLRHINWNSSHVTYGQCNITVGKGEHQDIYPCLFGHQYDYGRELSFRTEFDLVCGRSLLGDFAQTLVILGQGFGAVASSILSDRLGRKPVLVWSQMGLLVIGAGIALAPTFPIFAALKFMAGCFQQGVVTGRATLSVELFPTEQRSVAMLVMGPLWVGGLFLLTLISSLMQDQAWRSLQWALSTFSILALLQMAYLEESLCWLVANGRREEAEGVAVRAAKVSGKDLDTVLQALHGNTGGARVSDYCPAAAYSQPPQRGGEALESLDVEFEILGSMESAAPLLEDNFGDQGPPAHRLSLLDLLRHRRLFFFTAVIGVSWFTCAFTAFSLFLMSTSLRGNRFVNFALTAAMELPACFLFYYTVDRKGRKPIIQAMFLLAGIGVYSSGLCRTFKDSSLFGALSVVMAMAGVMGASGIFGALFFYTPELYPTNIRQQALGVASLTGRLGGMMAPFMVPLSEVVVWAPGAISGCLCFLVVCLFRLLPETCGRKLPQSLQDVDSWQGEGRAGAGTCFPSRTQKKR